MALASSDRQFTDHSIRPHPHNQALGGSVHSLNFGIHDRRISHMITVEDATGCDVSSRFLGHTEVLRVDLRTELTEDRSWSAYTFRIEQSRFPAPWHEKWSAKTIIPMCTHFLMIWVDFIISLHADSQIV